MPGLSYLCLSKPDLGRGGITEADLKRPHASKPRNPLIADVCFKAGYIDSWGRGTIRILESCDEFDLPEPEMTEFQGGFKVTLYKDRHSEDQLKKLGLNERQMKAVKFVKEHTQITNAEYQNLFNVSRNTASRDLTWIIHQEIWLWARRSGNGGGNVPKYVEYTISGTTQYTAKFRRVAQTKIKFNNMNEC